MIIQSFLAELIILVENILVLTANIMLIKTQPDVSTSCRNPLQGQLRLNSSW